LHRKKYIEEKQSLLYNVFEDKCETSGLKSDLKQFQMDEKNSTVLFKGNVYLNIG